MPTSPEENQDGPEAVARDSADFTAAWNAAFPESPAVKCPFCPVCGTPPDFIAPMLYQCWCPNEDCNVFMWVPWVSAAENLAEQGEVKIISDEKQK